MEWTLVVDKAPSLGLISIIEVLLQGCGIVRPSERKHEENTRLLGAEVVSQHAADLLEGKRRPFCGTQGEYAASRNARADDNRDAPACVRPESRQTSNW